MLRSCYLTLCMGRRRLGISLPGRSFVAIISLIGRVKAHNYKVHSLTSTYEIAKKPAANDFSLQEAAVDKDATEATV
jgi:hypothetical protein